MVSSSTRYYRQLHNTRPQRGLIAAGRKMTPALVGEKEDELIHAAEMQRAMKLSGVVDDLEITPGTQVRLLNSRYTATLNRDMKSQLPRWTQQTYEVLERVGANSFRIDTPPGKPAIWAAHSIQVVPDATKPTLKKKKKMVQPEDEVKMPDVEEVEEAEEAKELK